MKKLFLFVFIFLFLLLNVFGEEVDIAPHAKSAILVESSTGKILFSKDAHSKRSPASMTKMMTLLLAMESLDKGNIKLTDEVIVSSKASSMGGTQIFINEGSHINVETLLKGIGIASANDAAVAIAEYIGGTQSNFVKMMNDKAKELGCKNTNFKNPHGLDEENHYTTAYDLSLIARELVKYPLALKITSTYEDYIDVSGDNRWLVNTNKLVRFYSGIDGLKTGYTDDAGYCLTATMERNGMRLISVVMKEESKDERSEDTISLMEYGFSNFGIKKVYDKNKYKKIVYIDNAKNRSVNCYLKDDVNIVVNKNVKDVKYSVKEKLFDLVAPLTKNSKVGVLKLYYDNKVYEYNLIVKENIKKSNYFETIINIFKDMICGVKFK